MYEKMQYLPLFHGLSDDDFSAIIKKLKLDFSPHYEGDWIVEQGDLCTSFIYIISGQFDIVHYEPEKNVTIQEHIIVNDQPYLIEPCSIYTLQRTYENNYVFTSKGATFVIDKATFGSQFIEYPIIRSNLINYACNQLRKAHEKLNAPMPRNTEEVLKTYLRNKCVQPTGPKTIKAKMLDLAEAINEPRINVSNVLNEWEKRNLIQKHRYTFEINNLEQL